MGERARDDLAPGANLREAVLGGRLRPRMTQQAVDVAGADVLALAYARVELLEHIACRLAGFGWARQSHDVAVGVRFDAQPLLEQGQVAVVFAEQPVQVTIVFERHHQMCLSGPGDLAQACCRWPTHACQLGGLRFD